MIEGRERQLLQAFVELADTLVSDYDVVDLLYRLCEQCAAVLEVDAAGVMLEDADGTLSPTAASSETMRLLEVFELQQDEGPGPDAWRSGSQVLVPDLTDRSPSARWPMFARRALGDGFRAIFAFPLRLRAERVGALNLVREEPGPLTDRDVVAAQALADVATIGILQERQASAEQRRASQLQMALDSRVLIEQAKGMLAQQAGVDVGMAFELMRRYARSRRERLRAVAGAVVDRELRADTMLAEWQQRA